MRVLDNLGYNEVMDNKTHSPIVETYLGLVLVFVIAMPLTVLALDYFGILTK